jgi:hypothetical protein
MPTIRIPPGVMRGESRAMVPGRYYATNLVRWREGNLCPVGGWDRITPVPLASTPRAGHVWTDSKFLKHRAVVCDAHIYQSSGSDLVDITPPDFINAESVDISRGYGAGNYGTKDFGQDDEDRGGGNRFSTSVPVSFNVDNWNDEILIGTPRRPPQRRLRPMACRNSSKRSLSPRSTI